MSVRILQFFLGYIPVFVQSYFCKPLISTWFDVIFLFLIVSDIFCFDECSAVAELDLDGILFLTGTLSIL